MSDLLAFKVAFINRCAEEGLTLNQINDRVKTAVANAEDRYLTKEANPAAAFKGLAKLIGGAGAMGLGLFGLGAGSETAKRVIDATAPTGLGALTGFVADPTAASIIAGGTVGALNDHWGKILGGTGALLAGGGLLAGKAMATSRENPDAGAEIKHKELLNEYSRLTDRTRKATRQRRLLENRG